MEMFSHLYKGSDRERFIEYFPSPTDVGFYIPPHFPN